MAGSAGALANRARVSALFSEVAADTSPRGVIVGLRARWGLMSLFGAITALAAIGFFGQRQSESAATGAAGTLRLSAPQVVRGGLFFQSRIGIRARRPIEHPRIVLSSGWLEQMQLNSTAPDAMSEAGRDGRVVLSYDGLDGGERLVVWLQFQVNPTNVGRRSYDVELDDGDTPIARVDRAITWSRSTSFCSWSSATSYSPA
jgi:hypothetical protein